MALQHADGLVEVACNLLDAAAAPPGTLQARLEGIAGAWGLDASQVGLGGEGPGLGGGGEGEEVGAVGGLGMVVVVVCCGCGGGLGDGEGAGMQGCPLA